AVDSDHRAATSLPSSAIDLQGHGGGIGLTAHDVLTRRVAHRYRDRRVAVAAAVQGHAVGMLHLGWPGEELDLPVVGQNVHSSPGIDLYEPSRLLPHRTEFVTQEP